MIQEEFLQVYDKDGLVIKPLSRSEVHKKPVRHWHGVVNVWLVNKEGQIIVSKRSKTVTGNPGKWQTYFGGHVIAGMTHKETAVKELLEETGLNIQPAKLYLIDKGQFANDDHLHFYESYVYPFEGVSKDLVFNDGETSEAKWMTMEEYQIERTTHPEQWCNACNEENQNRIKQWLHESRE